MRAPSWRTIGQMEQSRWMQFCKAHPNHPVCARIVAAGRVTFHDTADLWNVSTAEGWPITRAGRAHR